jgi:hypothetical protein
LSLRPLWAASGLPKVEERDFTVVLAELRKMREEARQR